jgi:hypothetical protein
MAKTFPRREWVAGPPLGRGESNQFLGSAMSRIKDAAAVSRPRIFFHDSCVVQGGKRSPPFRGQVCRPNMGDEAPPALPVGTHYPSEKVMSTSDSPQNEIFS